MADKHKVIIVVLGNNLADLSAYFVFIERAVRDAKGDGHDLNGWNANITIAAVGLFIGRRVDVGKEVGIRVQADADAMNE